MTFLQAVLLGIIQGLTEFLPISSTAHLTIAGKLLGLVDPSRPEDWTAFIAIMQLGTVTAVILYFAGDLLDLLRGFLADVRRPAAAGKRTWGEGSLMLGNIIAGTVPVVVIGLALKKIIEGALTKDPGTIATSLIVLALLLLWAERAGKHVRTLNQTTWKDAIIIGLAQVCALVPGSSRSGTTITAGLFLGLNREAAARFSFLLSIPAVVGSGLFELYESRHHLGDMGISPLIVSTIVSGIVGYFCIAFLLRYLRTHTTYVFIVYRFLLGVGLWAMIMSRII